MKPYQVSSESLALILPAMDAGDIRPTVELFLQGFGLEAWDNIEAEVFPAGESCLLIARPVGPMRQRGYFRKRRSSKF